MTLLNKFFRSSRRRSVQRAKSRRLTFEGCEARQLLSASSGTTTLKLFSDEEVQYPLINSFPSLLTSGFTLDLNIYDGGPDRVPWLKLSYTEDGTPTFTRVAEPENALSLADTTISFAETGSVLGYDFAAAEILPPQQIPTITSPMAETQFNSPTARESEAEAISLRAAFAESEADSLIQIPRTAAHPALQSTIGVGVAAPLPPQRIQLNQDGWDKAWAFETVGFVNTQPPDAEPAAGRLDARDALFREFDPSPRRQVIPESGAKPRQSIENDTQACAERPSNGQTSYLAPAQSLPNDAPAPTFAGVFAAQTASAAPLPDAPARADLGIADTPPPAWWTTSSQQGRKIGGIALALVFARQAWLHARPTAAELSDEVQKPRRRR